MARAHLWVTLIIILVRQLDNPGSDDMNFTEDKLFKWLKFNAISSTLAVICYFVMVFFKLPITMFLLPIVLYISIGLALTVVLSIVIAIFWLTNGKKPIFYALKIHVVPFVAYALWFTIISNGVALSLAV